MEEGAVGKAHHYSMKPAKRGQEEVPVQQAQVVPTASKHLTLVQRRHLDSMNLAAAPMT